MATGSVLYHLTIEVRIWFSLSYTALNAILETLNSAFLCGGRMQLEMLKVTGSNFGAMVGSRGPLQIDFKSIPAIFSWSTGNTGGRPLVVFWFSSNNHIPG